MTSATAAAAAAAPLKQIQHDNGGSVDIQIPTQRKDVKEVVAQWRVPIRGKLYQIEFEHGTTSGKRVIWVDGKVCHFNQRNFFFVFTLFHINIIIIFLHRRPILLIESFMEPLIN